MSMPRAMRSVLVTKNVVAHDLDAPAESVGHELEAVPVVFGHAVFDRDDGVLFDEALVELDHARRVERGDLAASTYLPSTKKLLAAGSRAMNTSSPGS